MADVYSGQFDIFGGFKIFNDPKLRLADMIRRGWKTWENWHMFDDAWRYDYRSYDQYFIDDVFYTNPSEITIIAPADAWWRGGNTVQDKDGGVGYIGLTSVRESSEMVFWAKDPFDGNTRNPLVQQPYFKKLPNEVTKEYDPIYVKFRTTYLGNVYEAWFKIIERKPGRAMTENGTLRPVNIIAYLNGFFIPSLNVDGRTVVSEELLPYYGYDLTWCPVRNRLSITYNPCKFVIPDPELVNREVLRWQTFSKGDITRSVGATNVRVEIGTYWWRTGKEVTADRTTADDIRIYRIDGTMYVNIEDLGASSYDNLRREIIVNGQYGTMNVYDNDGKWVRTRIGESNIKVTRKRP